MKPDTPNPLEDPLGDWYIQYNRLVHYHIKQRLSKESPQDIEDLTSKVFDRAKRFLKGGSQPVVHPRKWLIKIADRLCIDYLREHNGKMEVVSTHYITSEGEEHSYLDDLECAEDDLPEVIAEKRALLAEAMQYLNELPAHQREPIQAYYLRGWSLERIAQNMGKSRSTVQYHMKMGLERVRIRFEHA
jgi:RNA polymerase sigma-70 factor (ECF subfamily)